MNGLNDEDVVPLESDGATTTSSSMRRVPSPSSGSRHFSQLTESPRSVGSMGLSDGVLLALLSR